MEKTIYQENVYLLDLDNLGGGLLFIHRHRDNALNNSVLSSKLSRRIALFTLMADWQKLFSHCQRSLMAWLLSSPFYSNVFLLNERVPSLNDAFFRDVI